MIARTALGRIGQPDHIALANGLRRRAATDDATRNRSRLAVFLDSAWLFTRKGLNLDGYRRTVATSFAASLAPLRLLPAAAQEDYDAK
jgi:hypothetical protein